MDKAGTAGMQLIDASWGESTHQFFENMHFGCRFVVWRVFYEDDWNKAKQQNQSPRSNDRDQQPAKEEPKRSITHH